MAPMSAPTDPPARGLGGRTWAIAGLLAGLMLVYLFAVASQRASGRAVIKGDAHYVYLAGRSLAYDGDVDLTNEYARFGDHWKLGEDPAADGWRLPVRELGPSLLMVPGLRLHRAIEAKPYLAPSYAVALAAMSIGLTFAGCAACLHALRRRGIVAMSAGRRDALALAATLGFVVPYYCMVSPGYAHAPDAAAVAWTTAAMLAGAGPVRVGLALAAALLMRLQNALWVVVPLSLWLVGPRRPGAWRRAAITLAVAGLGLVPQLYMNLAHPGSQRGAIRWGLDFFDRRGLVGDLGTVLFGIHGLWTWTPIAALATAGLLLGLRDGRTRGVATGALGLLAALTLLFAMARDPDGGFAFGARRHAGYTAFMAIGLAILFAAIEDRVRSPRARRLAVVAVGALVGALVVYNLAWTELAARRLVRLMP